MIKFLYATLFTLGSFLLCGELRGEQAAVYGDIPDYGEFYLSPDYVAKAPNGTLCITCRTGKGIMFFKDGKIAGKVKLSGYTGDCVFSPDSKKLYVLINAPLGKCAVVDVQTAKVEREFFVGHMPKAIAISPDAKFLYVSRQFTNEILKFNLKTLKAEGNAMAVRDPFSMLVLNDTIFVLNQIPMAKDASKEANIALSLSVIDAPKMQNIKNISLPAGSINGKYVCASPEGKYLFCSHVIGRFNVPTTQVEKGWVGTNAVSVIDAKKREFMFAFLLDDADKGFANPYALKVSPDGKTLYALSAGNHELASVDIAGILKKYADYAKNPKGKIAPQNDLSFADGLKKRIVLKGFGPRHMDFDEKGNLIVAMYYSDTLNKVSLPEMKVEKISIGGNEKMNDVRRGDLYFHDASLCFQNWLSCVTCHTQVRSDGLNWDLLNDGIGNPKQSKSMLYSHFTPPSMITGIRKDAFIAVRKGIRYIQFASRPEKDAVCIDKYLSSLREIPSPYLYDEKYLQRIENGAAYFEMAKCNMCHTGEYYTDMKMHNVKTGTGLYENAKFDTPTLREVWRTAPYLYNGKAPTIFDMLKQNKDNAHGETSQLSDSELRDLEIFVLSL